MASDKPDVSELEVVVFGKGVGESLLVHVGQGKWIIVDSFLTNSKVPVALEYLRSIGVSPKEAVVLAVITHWHDDHIRGITSILEECTSASFCCSLALTKNDFQKFVEEFATRNPVEIGAGTSELNTVYALIQRESGRNLIYACADKVIMKEYDCEVWSLSPSDRQIHQTLTDIAVEMPCGGKSKKRAVANNPNNTSVVLQIIAGEDSILLGADLEEISSLSGWSAIVGSKAKPSAISSLFKVPHHGSNNGHNDDVWNNLLSKEVVAAVTPYTSSNLPRKSDKDRILSKTPHAYIAKQKQKSKTKGISNTVGKSIKQFTKSYVEYDPNYGFVRLRKTIGSSDDWDVHLSPEACHLSSFEAAK